MDYFTKQNTATLTTDDIIEMNRRFHSRLPNSRHGYVNWDIKHSIAEEVLSELDEIRSANLKQYPLTRDCFKSYKINSVKKTDKISCEYEIDVSHATLTLRLSGPFSGWLTLNSGYFASHFINDFRSIANEIHLFGNNDPFAFQTTQVFERGIIMLTYDQIIYLISCHDRYRIMDELIEEYNELHSRLEPRRDGFGRWWFYGVPPHETDYQIVYKKFSEIKKMLPWPYAHCKNFIRGIDLSYPTEIRKQFAKIRELLDTPGIFTSEYFIN